MNRLRPASLLALCVALAAATAACKSESSGGSGGSPAASSGPAAGSEIEAGLGFLKAAAKLNHKDQVDDAWTEMAAFAGGKVKISAGSESGKFDLSDKKADAKVLRFSKLTSWRDGATIKGVLLGDVELKFEKGEVRGPGKLHLQAKGDQWVATLLEVEPGEPGAGPGAAGGGAAPAAVK
jgi:hypothetical protein